MTLTVQHISTSIDRTWREVYEYVVNPENLPLWAAGLGGSIVNVDGEWVADSPMGRVTVRFVERNDSGVLDHTVTLASGESFYNPMRVFANEDGSEVVFHLFRHPGTDDAAFDQDAAAISHDLATLKRLLES